MLIKARSLAVHDDQATQREDLLRLLALIDDPRTLASDLRGSERQWLNMIEQRLDLSRPSMLDAVTMRRAQLAYRLLAGKD